MADTSHRTLLESMEESDDESELADEQNFSSGKSALEEHYLQSLLNKISSTGMSLPKWSAIGVIVCFLACLIYLVLGADQVSCKTSLNDIRQQLLSVKDKFPSQDLSLWSGIFSGLINLTKKPVEPAVYLLVFDEASAESSSCIVEIITTLATKLIQPCEARKWLLLNGTQISQSVSQDPGDLIDAISREKEHSHIVVVPDVQKIPAKLAQGFHSLVDAYSSMSKKPATVYIFTLMIPHLDDVSKITDVAENILLVSWKDLDEDVLQPLVTRVSHFVLPITEENGAQSCPLKIDSTITVDIP